MKRFDRAGIPTPLGETTITAKNQVSLPAKGMRRFQWKRGDRLVVGALGDDMLVLIRRPERWTDAFAGRLTEVFGTQEDNLDWIERERGGWQEE